MLNRALVVTTLAAFLNCTFGCTMTRDVFKNDLRRHYQKIVGVELKDGSFVGFDEHGGQYVAYLKSIKGVTADGQPVEYKTREIRRVHVQYAGDERSQVVIKGVDEFLYEAERPPHEKIVGLVLPSGAVIDFDRRGGRLDPEANSISGISDRGVPIEMQLDEVLYLRVQRIDPASTCVATVGVLALGVLVVGVIVALTKESCPFVYAWDGEQYVLCAEPLGGAVCRGLQRSDWSELEPLAADHGRYKLLVRNEVEETQYLDQLKLVLVDHDPAYRVVCDTSGTMRFVAGTVGPSAAIDENRLDLLPFLSKRDNVAWQSHMATALAPQHPLSHHELIITFPKPPDARSALLVANVGSSLWGSNMIREMLQLRGDSIESWYQSINSGDGEADRMFQFIQREQIWLLDLKVREGNAWVSHGWLPGAGPLIVEDRALPLDLSGVGGDSVTIRLTPAFGFWSIDHLALSFDDFPQPSMAELSVVAAVDHRGDRIEKLIAAIDDEYYVMPNTGDWAEITFEAPPLETGLSRTCFLKSTGYYRIHLDETQPLQVERLVQIAATPGAAVGFAVEKYRTFIDSLRVNQ